jgi:type IX secretion system PorP/SprF family membrane protein
MKRNLLLIIVVFSCIYNLYSQENPLITQQWYSRINHNPASAGNNDAWDIFMVHRDQWRGFSNAPKTTMLNLHTSINDFNSGIGLSAAYDAEGPARTSLIAKLVYSYRINVTELSQLAFGLGANIQNRRIDYNKLTVEDIIPDPEKGGVIENRTSFGVDFGLEFLTERLTIGASVTNLGRTRKSLTSFLNGTQYYGYAHYKFPVSDEVDFSPTLNYVYGNTEHLFEVGATLFYQDDVWGGLAYRIDNAICAFAGFRFGIFRLGYSFDYHTNDANKFGSTHEIILSIRIAKPQRGMVRNVDGSYRAPLKRIYHCR